MYRPPGIGAQPRVADLRTPGTAGTAARDRPGRAWDLARLGPSASPTSSSRPTSSCSLRRRALSVAVLAYASARVVSSRGSPYVRLPSLFSPPSIPPCAAANWQDSGGTSPGPRRDRAGPPAGTPQDGLPGRPRDGFGTAPGRRPGLLGRPGRLGASRDVYQDPARTRKGLARTARTAGIAPGLRRTAPRRDAPGIPAGTSQDFAQDRRAFSLTLAKGNFSSRTATPQSTTFLHVSQKI